jgi:hypothetical protein
VTPPKILLFGDSHSYAIQRALQRREKRGQPIPLSAHRLLKMKGETEIGDTSFENFLELVRPLKSTDVVLSAIGGNSYAVFSTIQHPEPFDFIDPHGGPDADSRLDLIPYRILETHFTQAIGIRDGKSLERLRKATTARVVHVIPPPPKGDDEFITQYHESVFRNEGIASRGVSPASLRLKFWLLQTRVLGRLCKERDVEVLMPPAAAFDEEGFLSPDYYAKDATHANPDYGELILQEIEGRYCPAKAEAGQK